MGLFLNQINESEALFKAACVSRSMCLYKCAFYLYVGKVKYSLKLIIKGE